MGDVYTNALVNVMHYSLEEVQTETSVDTLRDLEAKEYANKLTDSVADVKVEKVGGTLKGCEKRITSLHAGRFVRRGGCQDGWQNTGRRGGPGTGRQAF